MADKETFTLEDILAEYGYSETSETSEDKKEEQPIPDVSERKVSRMKVPDAASENAETPKPEAVPEKKSEAPKPEAVPEKKSEVPKSEAAPEKKSETPKPEAVPEKKSEAPKPEAAPEKKSETPKPEAAPEKNAEAPKPEAAPEKKTEAPKPEAAPEKTEIVQRDKAKRDIFTNSRSFEQKMFLFKQLVKRDFKGRYKGTFLGVLWSMISPLFVFTAQAIIFSVLFNRQNHFISFLIIGNVVFHYYTDCAHSGMTALASNGGIISTIKVPKSIFLLSKTVSCMINFFLTMIIMFIVTSIDGLRINTNYLMLAYPIVLMTIFNIGFGYMLSAWYIFFKDTQYLFNLFTSVLTYFSCIFYSPDRFPEAVRGFFYLNPVYCYIYYFRRVIVDRVIPDSNIHVLCFFYAFIVLFIGLYVYKRNNSKFVYYF